MESIVWRDFPLGSSAKHDDYELRVVAASHCADTDGSRQWFGTIDYAADRRGGGIAWASRHTFPSREIAKLVTECALDDVVAFARMPDSEFVSIVVRAANTIGARVIEWRANIPAKRIERWMRGECLPLPAMRHRDVAALKRISEQLVGALSWLAARHE